MPAPGPVETLARLALQSDRYASDPGFRDAVDAVLGNSQYDAAPDLLAALKDVERRAMRIREDKAVVGMEASFIEQIARDAFVRATGKE